MTKYILNSGGITNATDQGKSFFNEIIKGLGSRPKVLFCFFASPREDWEEKFTQYVEGFQTALPSDITPVFDLAFPQTFAEQIKTTDAMYIPGGDDHLLLYWLRQFDLPALWEGKVIATNSASSDALSRHFWAVDWRQCMDGLGILPIKFIAHYEGWDAPGDPRGAIDWPQAKQELTAYGDASLPVYALREGQYEVFNC